MELLTAPVDGAESTLELEAGHAAAAELADTPWQLDAEPELQDEDESLHLPQSQPAIELSERPGLFPLRPPPIAETPPLPEQIVEAMLFVGGSPVTHATVVAVIRGLEVEQFREIIDGLARKYKQQNRPYGVEARADGYVLTVKARYRAVREKLFGGPRAVRLSQPGLDVLSLIAYKQPLTKAELDSLRGSDCGGVLRMLVRLGLVATGKRTEVPADSETGSGKEVVCYRTTPRFLETFGLSTMDDLPRLGDAS